MNIRRSRGRTILRHRVTTVNHPESVQEWELAKTSNLREFGRRVLYGHARTFWHNPHVASGRATFTPDVPIGTVRSVQLAPNPNLYRRHGGERSGAVSNSKVLNLGQYITSLVTCQSHPKFRQSD